MIHGIRDKKKEFGKTKQNRLPAAEFQNMLLSSLKYRFDSRNS